MGSTARVAVVTGAAQGIGRRGAEALGVAGDVAAEADVAALAARVADRFGRVDVLVNNAGVSLLAAAEETTPAQWRRVLEVNLTGPFLLCQAFGRAMLRARGGSIVNVASIAGLRGFADRAAYNASKHGLVGLTRTLAAEWGGRGVRVNAVCPGWVKTEMDAADQAGGGYSADAGWTSLRLRKR